LCAKLQPVKTLHVVRHCQAEGQDAGARLTPEGIVQANSLADVLARSNMERIICSADMRATQSIAPLAQRLGLEVELDMRLVERTLGSGSTPDWRDRLRVSFVDLDLSFEGGETSRSAMQRAVAVVEDALKHSAQRTLLVTHGNLMTLLLKHFDDSIGFADWYALTNPDVYQVVLTQPVAIHRVWHS
jgi:2,3-bisphosphoglycerate-dependent phosphoglycerate mutase